MNINSNWVIAGATVALVIVNIVLAIANYKLYKKSIMLEDEKILNSNYAKKIIKNLKKLPILSNQEIKKIRECFLINKVRKLQKKNQIWLKCDTKSSSIKGLEEGNRFLKKNDALLGYFTIGGEFIQNKYDLRHFDFIIAKNLKFDIDLIEREFQTNKEHNQNRYNKKLTIMEPIYLSDLWWMINLNDNKLLDVKITDLWIDFKKYEKLINEINKKVVKNKITITLNKYSNLCHYIVNVKIKNMHYQTINKRDPLFC